MGALFLDGSGETVDLACADFSPYEMRVVGAYLGIYLRQLERFLAGNRLGEPRMIHIEKQAVHIYAVSPCRTATTWPWCSATPPSSPGPREPQRRGRAAQAGAVLDPARL